MRYFAVFLSENPGVFIEEDGPQQGAIVTEVAEGNDPPQPSYFGMACTEFQLGCPRLSKVLPYFDSFDPETWRNASIGPHVFWTNREPDSFPV